MTELVSASEKVLAATPLAKPRRDFPTWAKGIWPLTALPLLLFFIIPILALFLYSSPSRLWASLLSPQVLQAIGVSLKTSAFSLLLVLLTGTPLAYWVGRHTFPFKKIVETIIDLPTILPPSVAGVALLLTLGRYGLLGKYLSLFGVQIAFTPLAVVLAQVFISAPYYIRAAVLGFAAVDREIVQAAQLDGASPWQLFRFVVLPISRLALVSGGVMSWARALGEFGATIIFAGNFPGRTQTMPLAIYLGFEMNLDTALTLSVILVLISFLAILLVRIRVGKQEEY